MSALKRRPRRWRGVRAFGPWVALVAVASVSGRDAEGAAIHRHAAHPSASVHPVGGMPAAELHVFQQWSRYLLAGPAAWKKVEHPPWTQSVKAAVLGSLRTDVAGAEPMVNYLLWKRSLNPTRFARYHPRIAPRLHRIGMARSSPILAPTSSALQTIASPGGGTPSTPSMPSPGSSQDNLIPPPPVPEPGMLLLASAMMAWAFRRFRARPPVPSSGTSGSW